jgi:hypothetical protein
MPVDQAERNVGTTWRMGEPLQQGLEDGLLPRPVLRPVVQWINIFEWESKRGAELE